MRRTSARSEGERQRKLAPEEEEDARGQIERLIYEEAEENGTEAAEAERAQEIDSPAEADSKQEDNRTTRQDPGGMWLLQEAYDDELRFVGGRFMARTDPVRSLEF
ncbi:hypothetical protein NDU88_000864 [Pleurodeles waltl]|uniref:Uncharacterized protein n=1 Tax=Pleurodeles waltl TaxID=8319 RepID=A0AAV7TIG5_PLEWA|nr:hypothetical protein NDU88_000864 [Pleurodeles waltl]